METAALDIDYLKQWIGRQHRDQDLVTPWPAARLAATLDRDDPMPQSGDPLPPLWHWLYGLPMPRQSDLGPDGHAKRGGFLPDVPLPRRMWAGGRLQFRRHLRIGEALTRVSTVKDISIKSGRAGQLCFVLVHHAITGDQGADIVEEHDIVYRDLPAPGSPAAAPRPARQDAAWQREIIPDDVFLFRYSALTFNGHRIHYDRRYVTEVEGYPGLIVHGPLIATLLADLARRNVDRPMASFNFRAVSPIFDTGPFTVNGGPAEARSASLWASTKDGALAMEAEAAFF
jgi:3-methylfumaryl-CoA hydratase